MFVLVIVNEKEMLLLTKVFVFVNRKNTGQEHIQGHRFELLELPSYLWNGCRYKVQFYVIDLYSGLKNYSIFKDVG